MNEHKFEYNFRDFLNPLCACNLKPEKTSHYLLRCHLFQIERRAPLNDIKEIDELNLTDHKNDLDLILLYGNERYRDAPLEWFYYKFCIDSKSFDLLLFQFVIR